jgi:membrane protein YqaA with SNARE-associated domain
LKFLTRLSGYLQLFGVPGLFFIALLDSAAIPLPGGPEAVITLLSWRRPSEAILIAVAAAVGSTLGCLFLYRVARAGGDLALARIPAAKLEKVRGMVERNALWAVFLSVALPPPVPTKPIILAAGAFRMPIPAFTLAVVAGRAVRYSILAYLGARFGDEAARIIRARYPWIALALVVIVLGGWSIRRIRHRKS